MALLLIGIGIQRNRSVVVTWPDLVLWPYPKAVKNVPATVSA